MAAPDGYWRVEVFQQGRQQWYRILHANTVVQEKAALGTVQRILGDAYDTLEPVNLEDGAA